MRKAFAVVAILLLSLSIADARARTRVVVQKPAPFGLDRQYPGYALNLFLAYTLCQFVAWSVPPGTPAGHPRLGRCPPREAVTPYI